MLIPLLCHSGLSGIFPDFLKDSRRASFAGMTAFKREPLLRQVLLYTLSCLLEMFDHDQPVPLFFLLVKLKYIENSFYKVDAQAAGPDIIEVPSL